MGKPTDFLETPRLAFGVVFVLTGVKMEPKEAKDVLIFLGASKLFRLIKVWRELSRGFAEFRISALFFKVFLDDFGAPRGFGRTLAVRFFEVF